MLKLTFTYLQQLHHLPGEFPFVPSPIARCRLLGAKSISFWEMMSLTFGNEGIHTVDGFEIRLTSWCGKNIPLFTGFYTSQVVSRISEPSTVWIQSCTVSMPKLLPRKEACFYENGVYYWLVQGFYYVCSISALLNKRNNTRVTKLYPMSKHLH